MDKYKNLTDLEKQVSEFISNYFLPCLSERMLKEDYGSAEYNQAEGFLTPYLHYFKKIDSSVLIQLFRTQIVYIKWVLENYQMMDETEVKISSERYREFKKMVPKFLKVMRSFQFAMPSGNTKKDIEFEKRTKLFNITRITFEGKRDKIVLEGDILDIIREMFQLVGNIDTEEKMEGLKFFAKDLHNAYWGIWFTEVAKISQVKKFFNPGNKEQYLSEIKKIKAFQIHRFLKDFSTIVIGDKITEKEKKFIGDFFISTGLCQDEEKNLPNYLDTVHYNDVRNWIIRGNYL